MPLSGACDIRAGFHKASSQEEDVIGTQPHMLQDCLAVSTLRTALAVPRFMAQKSKCRLLLTLQSPQTSAAH